MVLGSNSFQDLSHFSKMEVGKTFKKVKFDNISDNKTVLPKEGTFNRDSILHCETDNTYKTAQYISQGFVQRKPV